jgi:hypothetical protein
MNANYGVPTDRTENAVQEYFSDPARVTVFPRQYNDSKRINVLNELN